MTVDKLVPNDPRAERKEAQVNGRTYTYLLAKPEGTPKGHVVLVHGFPDLAFGWRYQIPFLVSLGYEVLAPNMLGYGGTTTPDADDAAWSFKSMSDDLAALTAAVWSAETRIILGGHDWGGALVWRVALWHPELLIGVFSICTPYWAPAPVYLDLEVLVKSGKLPNFAYQLQFISGEVEENVKTPDEIRRLLLAIWGARTEDTREPGFTAEKGYDFEKLKRLAGKSPLVSEEELAEHVRIFSEEGSGIVGPLRWYRMRKQTFEEERPLVGAKVQVPSLFVQASRDTALPPAMAVGMGDHFVDLTSKTVEASHWALWEAPDKVNGYVRDWLAEKFGSSL
ncbi:epoxide hydrolase [Plectosphaerella plurivora]|uniref:Epoxide hydrolase n=1 Tax=Plectosphaerella plurivora TaxID=936078 RepID=A0A9P8VDM1_9PEZI|nr:epoxide hydrolase [Plectosphaerella plurivora]